MAAISKDALDLEKAILGLCLKGQIDDALNLGLNTEHFGDSDHKKIYLAIRAVYDRGCQLDLAEVGMALNDKNLVSKLVDIETNSPVTQRIEIFVSEAKKRLWCEMLGGELSRLQNLITQRRQYDQIEPIRLAIESLQSAIVPIGAQTAKRTDEGAINVWINQVISEVETKGKVIAPTGIKELDFVFNGGFNEQMLITIAARPGMGKTALTTNMALNAAKAGHRVQFFTNEIDMIKIIDRLVCSEADIDTRNMSQRKFQDNALDKLYEAAKGLIKLPITIEDSTKCCWETLESLIRREKRTKDLKVVFIDYIQQFRMRTKSFKSRHEEVGEMTFRAKNLGKELKICVVVNSQLNRSIETRVGQSPQLSDLKDSGNIEQDSDIVLILHGKDRDIINGHVLKNREGEIGPVFLRANLAFNKFYYE